MVAFYNQGDQEIYDEGEHFIPQQQYRLNKFNNTVAPMPMDSTQQVTQEFGIPYTNAFTNAGGGGGGGGGLSDYGLDESNMKMFYDQNVWDGSSWVNKPVRGYYDPASKTYKTKKGKNIVHGGLFTGDPKKGDIEGEDFQFPGVTGAIAQWLKNKAVAAKEKISDTFTGAKDETITTTTDGKDGMDQTVIPDAPTSIGQSLHGNMGMPQGNAPGGTSGGTYTGHGSSGMGRDPEDKMADGGRIGFFQGALADTAEGQAMSPGTSATGEFRGGGDGGQGDGNNQGNTGGITQLDTDLMRTDPSMELNYDFKKLPLYLQAKLHNKNLLTEDNINLEGQVGGSAGLVDYGIDFTGEGVTGSHVGAGPLNVDIDPHKNIRNISLNQDIGNWNFQGNTDLENYGLGVNYNQEGGPFFAGGSMDNMGNKNFNVGAKWSWGEPERPVNALSYDDLIYGQNLRYGGLAGLL